MSATTANSNTNITNNLICKSINDDYEWIQYNKELRIIRSIKDDMYQMQSIINVCDSNKQATRWVNSEDRTKLFNEIATMQNCTLEKVIQNRTNLPNGLRGYYINRYLVNHVAIWASETYAVHILKLLDDIASREREELAKTIAAKDDVIAEQAQNI